MSQEWKTTSVFREVLDWFHSDDYFLGLEGGTSSSKTYSAIMALSLISRHDPVPKLTSVVGESIPHLKGGAIRDFKDIMGDTFDDKRWNATDRIYKFPSGSEIEFFPADDSKKLRGKRRDRLYINEANNISHESAKALMTRTRDRKFIIDHNPVAEYWAHEYQSKPGARWNNSTYLDAIHVLPETTVAEIESRKNDANWWHVYGLGLVGKIEGRIIPDFELVDRLPAGIETECGLDFGFTNDPSCLLEAGVNGGKIYVNELYYKRGMTNQDHGREMKKLGIPSDYWIYADSAEPKSIKEIQLMGFLIKPGFKGGGKHKGDAFNVGIDYIKRYRICVTKTSVNVIKDFRNAMWGRDLDDKWTNLPARGFLHSIDALRYALTSRIKPPSIVR